MPTTHDIEAYAKAILADMAKEANDKGEWEGRMTELVGRHAPNAYYSRVVNLLVMAEAIKQIRRGGGTTLSKWKVLRKRVDLSKVSMEDRKRALKRPSSVENRLQAIEDRIGTIKIPTAIAALARRDDEIKGALEALGRQVSDAMVELGKVKEELEVMRASQELGKRLGNGR